jgi:hypothetical protein
MEIEGYRWQDLECMAQNRTRWRTVIVCLMVFNATFNNISVIGLSSVADFLIYFINLQHDNHSLNNFHNWVSLKSGRQ